MTTLDVTLFSASEQSGYQLDFKGSAPPRANVGLVAAKPGSNTFNLVSAFSTGEDGGFRFRVAYPPSVKGQTWRFMATIRFDPAINSAVVYYTFPEFEVAPPPPGEIPSPVIPDKPYNGTHAKMLPIPILFYALLRLRKRVIKEYIHKKLHPLI